MTTFQLLLAAGLPLGRLAWGGAHRVLAPRLRAASLAAAALGLLGGTVVAQAGSLGPEVLPPGAVRPVLGILSALFALSLLGNLASRSRAERFHGVPLAAVLALSPALLAASV